MSAVHHSHICTQKHGGSDNRISVIKDKFTSPDFISNVLEGVICNLNHLAKLQSSAVQSVLLPHIA